MREVSRFRLSDGGVVNMEVDADDSVDLAYRGPAGYEARAPFSHTMRTIGQAVSEAVESLIESHGPGRRPRELSIEFNVRLSAEAGATVVSDAANGHFRIKATWDSESRAEEGARIARRADDDVLAELMAEQERERVDQRRLVHRIRELERLLGSHREDH
ncbi:CU044_2847 family protein [Streptomyces sp. NPDC006798]|uniref:CU044_2847 family protein n=1 Tax=Streptomyces sp. NPDC006798 TaxID=3155462 RepID=UPI0034029771